MERRMVDAHLTQLAMQARDGAEPKIAGYAAVFYDGSSETEFEFFGMHERIMRSAFNNAIGRDDVRALFNHDSNYVLGRTASGTLKLSVDEIGLRYEIDPPDHAASLVESIERGDITGSSFAFTVRKQRMVDEGGKQVREIHDLDLFDVGPVAFPAYSGTAVGIRSLGDTSEAEAFAKAYREQVTEKQERSRLMRDSVARAVLALVKRRTT